MKVDFRDVLVFGGIGLMSAAVYMMWGASPALFTASAGFFILGIMAKL